MKFKLGDIVEIDGMLDGRMGVVVGGAQVSNKLKNMIDDSHTDEDVYLVMFDRISNIICFESELILSNDKAIRYGA